MLYLLDCRAAIAATGNSLKGAGVENAKNYTNATLKYCNIGNIHTMRNSLHALTDLVTPSGASGKVRAQRSCAHSLSSFLSFFFSSLLVVARGLFFFWLVAEVPHALPTTTTTSAAVHSFLRLFF